MDTALISEARKQVITALNVAERKPKPAISELFTDVYHDVPSHLQEQQRELTEHLSKYPNEYDMDSFQRD